MALQVVRTAGIKYKQGGRGGFVYDIGDADAEGRFGNVEDIIHCETDKSSMTIIYSKMYPGQGGGVSYTPYAKARFNTEGGNWDLVRLSSIEVLDEKGSIVSIIQSREFASPLATAISFQSSGTPLNRSFLDTPKSETMGNWLTGDRPDAKAIQQNIEAEAIRVQVFTAVMAERLNFRTTVGEIEGGQLSTVNR